MSCNCVHHREDIKRDRKLLQEFKELFIKRMTVDSETQDKRKKDYNQAIFFYDDYSKEYKPVWNEITLGMVLQCFDDAVRDYRKLYCDTENCNRK